MVGDWERHEDPGMFLIQMAGFDNKVYLLRPIALHAEWQRTQNIKHRI